MDLENKFFQHLATSGGPELVERAMGKRLSPEDARAYHIALAETCQAIGDPEDPLGAVAFAVKWRPRSKRKAGHRPPEYWDAAEPWASLVLAAAKKLPQGILSERLLADARFFRAVTSEQVVMSSDGNFRACKPARDLLWRISGKTEESTLGFPLYWGVLSSRGVRLETAKFKSCDSRVVFTVLLTRWDHRGKLDRAAMCEFVSHPWERMWHQWRVERYTGDEHTLANTALLIPEPHRARLADHLLEVGAPPEFPREYELVITELRFYPRPRWMREVGCREFWAGWDRATSVEVQHPARYAVQLDVPEGQAIHVTRLPGVTRSVPSGDAAGYGKLPFV